MAEHILRFDPNAEQLIGAGRIFPIGEKPPPGKIPELMFAQVIRADRVGRPENAFQREVVKTPRPENLGPREAIIGVEAAALNHNVVYAALGYPQNFITPHKRTADAEDEEGFLIGGSDASGIVYAVGSEVENVKVGDHVVAHCAMWDENDPQIVSGKIDPTVSKSFKVWGLEGNWGSFAQFAKVQAHQLMRKAEDLAWEEAASLTLDGGTAYRMYRHWTGNTLEKGDFVLIWGGSGGLGSIAIQLAKALGGRPIAVVSSPEKGEWCKSIGAEGYIDRTEFKYWKEKMPDPNDRGALNRWLVKGPVLFEKKLLEITGGVNPKIVFEHTGEQTIPTSMHVCAPMGMVVICAGLTGYKADTDLLRLWPPQKRLQGSHVFNDEEANAFNNLVLSGQIKPHLSPESIFTFDQTGLAHQMMRDNTHPFGKSVVLVNSPRPGLKS